MRKIQRVATITREIGYWSLAFYMLFLQDGVLALILVLLGYVLVAWSIALIWKALTHEQQRYLK